MAIKCEAYCSGLSELLEPLNLFPVSWLLLILSILCAFVSNVFDSLREVGQTASVKFKLHNLKIK